MNYSLDNMTQSQKNYDKLINTIEKINDSPTIERDTEEINNLIKRIEKAEENIITAMDDDFNTPVAIAEIMTLFREMNRVVIEEKVEINSKFKDKFFNFINDIDKIFGIFPNLKERLEGGFLKVTDEKDKIISGLLEIFKETRSKLRAQKIYEISDFIREKLQELGINLEDK